MKKHYRILVSAAALSAVIFCGSCTTYSSQKSAAAIEKRVESVVTQMTLEEKLQFLGGTGFVPGDKIGETLPIERLGVPAFKMTDATLGPKMTKGATLFPSYICQAAAFNPELAYAYGNAVGELCAADGYRILLGPGVNIYRVPNCGRNFEYLGEDPYLASETVVEYIKGVQKVGVIATVKHFLANNTEFYRSDSNSMVSERALREIYMPAFKAAVQRADVKAVMTSYNLINGVHAAENKWTITDVLRKDWGFNGLVMTDWYGARTTDLLILSGSDLEMPQPEFLKAEKIKPLLENGQVTEALLDERIANVLRPCLEMDLLDQPQEDPSLRANWPKHAEISRQVAREGLVLLKNENVLPLDRKTVKRVALVGSNAELTVATGGGAAGFEPGPDFLTYAAAIKQSAGTEVNVFFATPEQAANADVALVFVTMVEHENMDRPFAFPPETVQLIQKTAAANENTVVIVSLGGGVDMMPWIDSVDGLIYAWYPGTYGAVALGEMVFGDLNPSGKLPITLEKRPEDAHYFGNYLPDDAKLGYTFPGWDAHRERYDVNYREGVLVGYRWFDTKAIEPLFPFGYGLSYTTFDFGDLKLSKQTLKGDRELQVSFTLSNTGDVAGAEVAQLYIQDMECSVLRPLKELKGFEKVYLEPGESKKVTLTISKEDLSFWDSESKAWTAENGVFRLHVGNSSRDIKLTADFVYEQ
jgi:beta-glucosidase